MNAIILSGGEGSRIKGKEKAFLPIGKDTFISLIIRKLRGLFNSIIIVTNKPELYVKFPVETVKDEKGGVGPLMGLYSGLKHSSENLNFVTTCDSPFINKKLIKYFIKKINGYDALIPEWKGKIEPLCAVYSKRCLPYIEKTMDKRRIISFYGYVNIKFVPEKTIKKLDREGLSFFNVNTQSDYRNCLEIFNLHNLLCD